MRLADIKEQISRKTIDSDLLIFHLLDDNTFIVRQYIKEISKIKSIEIEYLESVDNINKKKDIFAMFDCPVQKLRVLFCDKFEEKTSCFLKEKNLIIVSKEISDITSMLYESAIVDVPKLKEWQIKDYVYSQLYGVKTTKLDWLIDMYHYDIDRLALECDKFKGFNSTLYDNLFNEFIKDGVFTGASIFTVFSLTDAIMQRDVQKLKAILYEIDDIDAEPMGVVTILLNNFRNMIDIQMTANCTPQTIGMSDKQFYFLSKRIGIYSNNELVRIYKLLTEFDNWVKSGYISTDMLLDYIIVKVMGGFGENSCCR